MLWLVVLLITKVAEPLLNKEKCYRIKDKDEHHHHDYEEYIMIVLIIPCIALPYSFMYWGSFKLEKLVFVT